MYEFHKNITQKKRVTNMSMVSDILPLSRNILSRQIKDAGKRLMYPHLISIPRGYLLDLAVIVCMH